MKRLYLLLCLVFLQLLMPVAARQTLTEATIQTMLSEHQKAMDYRNIEAIMHYYAPDAVVTLVFLNHRGIRKTYTRPEYQRLLLEGWNVGKNLTYKVREQTIKIGPDGQSAVASSLIVATSSLRGDKYYCQTRQKIGVILREGRPMIKLYYGQVACE